MNLGSLDYEAFDFRHQNGCRLEVKQTSAKQSWPQTRASRPIWDIRARKGRWDGQLWIAEPGRNADIYVLAYHALFEGAVDHRDPLQWICYCIAASELPADEIIALGDPIPTIASATKGDGRYDIVVTWATGSRSQTTDVIETAAQVLTFKVYKPLRNEPISSVG